MIPKLRFPQYHQPLNRKSIDEILSIGSGKDYKHLGKGEIPVYGTGGLMTYVDEYLYDGESVGIGRKGTIDKPIFLNGKFWTVDTLFYTHSFKGVDPYFVFTLFQQIKWHKYNEASGVPSLSKSTVGSIHVFVPKEEEQLRIRSLFEALNTKINLLTKKKEALETYKKGLMQKIFSQELRFKRDDGTDYPEWETKKLSDVAQKSSVKNKDFKSSRVLTNSAIRGVVAQEDFFDREIVTEKNLESYYVSKTGDFIYNPRISSNAPCGPVNRNEIGEGLFSPLYTVFKVKPSYNDYLSYFFQTNLWYKYALAVSNFGARHDRMNISTSDFFSLPFDAPTDKSEMEQIVSVAVCLNQKIELLNNSLNSLLEFKKGLLQQMFV